MADFKLKYPSSNADGVDVTITLNGLATNTQNVFTSGRQSTVIDNRTDLDLDHLLTGRIRIGLSPAAGRTIAVYVFGSYIASGGTALYPDQFTGTDSNRSITSANVLNSMLRLAWSTTVDNTSNRDYFIPPTSIASLFGGILPPRYGYYVAHDTNVNLESSGHTLQYTRIQTQSV